MKTPYWFLIIIAILMYNSLMISRDQKMFDAYDRLCAQLPTGHPDCIFAKTK